MFKEVPLSKAYRLLHPKLTVLVVASKGEKVNAMAAAWVMPVSARPPLIAVSIAPKRYTYELIKATGEFTVNVMSVETLKQTHYCGTVSGRDTDKIKTSGLKLEKSLKISTPCLADAVACLECKVYKTVEVGDHELFIGEVVAARVKEGVFDERYLIDKVKLLFHLGGDNYTTNSGEVLKP